MRKRIARCRNFESARHMCFFGRRKQHRHQQVAHPRRRRDLSRYCVVEARLNWVHIWKRFAGSSGAWRVRKTVASSSSKRVCRMRLVLLLIDVIQLFDFPVTRLLQHPLQLQLQLLHQRPRQRQRHLLRLRLRWQQPRVQELQRE